MQPAQLTKATILDESTRQQIAVMYNPEQFTLDEGNNFAEVAIPGLPVPPVQYVRGKARVLSLELFFDTYEQGADVRQYSDQVVGLLAQDPQTQAPPVLVFTMGPFAFRCVLVEANQRFTMFLRDGTPVRASVAVKFQEYARVDVQVQAGFFFLGSQVTVGVLVTGSLAATGRPWTANAFGLLLLLLAPLVLHFYARFPNRLEARRSRVPSGWTPLGLLVHLTAMERRWLVWGFLGEPVEDPWRYSAADGGWQVPDGWTLVTLESVGSTNDEAAHLADQGAPEGAVVCAREQTGGDHDAMANRHHSSPTAIGGSLPHPAVAHCGPAVDAAPLAGIVRRARRLPAVREDRLDVGLVLSIRHCLAIRDGRDALHIGAHLRDLGAALPIPLLETQGPAVRPRPDEAPNPLPLPRSMWSRPSQIWPTDWLKVE